MVRVNIGNRLITGRAELRPVRSVAQTRGISEHRFVEGGSDGRLRQRSYTVSLTSNQSDSLVVTSHLPRGGRRQPARTDSLAQHNFCAPGCAAIFRSHIAHAQTATNATGLGKKIEG